jgi:hypothetical protein
MDALALLVLTIGGLAVWPATMWLLSRAGGWSVLALRFRDRDARPEGAALHMQWVRLGWVGYNGCVTVRISERGLRLSLWPGFDLFHPPLLIPWSELRDAREGRIWFVRCAIVSIPPVRLHLPRIVWNSARPFLQRGDSVA